MFIKRIEIIKYLLPSLVLFLTLVSANQWNRLPIGNTFVVWLISISIIIAILFYKRKFFNPSNKQDYLIVLVYFIWLIISIVRGCFVASNYWEWKQLIVGSLNLSLPIWVYVFSIPWLLKNVLKFWLKYAIPIFIFFFIWSLRVTGYQFYLGPVFLIGCFLPLGIPRKWFLIVLGLLFLMLIIDLGSRSQVIKAFLSISFSVGLLFNKILTNKLLQTGAIVFVVLPVLLLFLGITGQFNIFKNLSVNEGHENVVKEGEEDLSADTRTFIYQEVISSAIKHNYVWWGRTPARGNDSRWFGRGIAKDLGVDKEERHFNELCFPNVFTWLGFVGMFMYCLIYLKSIYLALYKSNSIILKMIGVYIAFRFFYGWIEDVNIFDISSAALWMFIAMGYSVEFRKMSNEEFKIWVKSIFKSL
ncbi:hypothetical protein [Wenyingzhuangia sp. 2_MG-2023]|uniref:hypothetical protein n=1 Tax=Wenyingzhuangia sp. 2_MG-2023 TaxID=3062639 RepID=UPI0026E3970B|nr:hypothetical protein [Wenyingzhuangia sp. 2_MG-2023]MDO6739092.1 hypothetical protein [Wenyingzhuangia sp. 2_MG-2023]